MNDFISTFNNYFEVVPANTSELETELFRLRYQVYCLEMGWEAPCGELARDGLAHDDYDARSMHYLLRHRGRGEYVGTVRLILPNVEAPESLSPLSCMPEGIYTGNMLLWRSRGGQQQKSRG
jgi:N-acyl amino acid synthase of PEP-CTERM/exosortase system